jgi:phosphoribosylamine--glycine ligase
MARVERDIIQPTIAGFKKDGIVYKGFVYIGLMLVGDTPYVIEYNCRMGDPETQVVMPRLTTDLVQLFVAVSKGQLDKETIEISSDAACTVVVASGGYPEHFEKGKAITGLEDVKDSIVFHAGTKCSGSDIVTNGGRVLTITSLGNNITAAVQKSLASITKINFEGKYHRSDIGYEFK